MIQKVDEIQVNGGFDVNAAGSAIAFYWNLCRLQRKKMVVKIFTEDEDSCSRSPTEMERLYSESTKE